MSIFKEELPNRKNKQQNLHNNVNQCEQTPWGYSDDGHR